MKADNHEGKNVVKSLLGGPESLCETTESNNGRFRVSHNVTAAVTHVDPPTNQNTHEMMHQYTS